MDDFLTELLTVACVSERLIVSALLDTHRLCGDAETRTIHECHHIFDQTQLAVSAKLSLGVLIDKLASRASMDTEFVLDTTHVDATLILVVDEHGKSTSVAGALLRTCKHEVDVRVSVGDETFHTVEEPASVLLRISCLEHNRLEVGTCIRLSEVHRHGLTVADTWNEALTLILVAELIECLNTILK